MIADVLVVGLGPAGASAAAAAAKAGARVVALDRRVTPGLPVQCAEFVPAMLDTPALARAARQDIDAMETWIGETQTHTPDFRGVMIDRAAFDAALLAEAIAEGVQVQTGTPYDGTQTARVVIGADGPRSTVGRLSGMVNRALVEARQVTVSLTQPHRATDIFLSADYPGGYGWLFPSGDQANIGLGVIPSARAQLKPLLQALCARLLAEGRIKAAQTRLTGGAIPVGGIAGLSGRIGETPVLLAGDAAGLANPITGAGINAAVLSGRLAGEAAARLSQGRMIAAEDYAEEVTDLFGPSLSLALARRAELLSRIPTEAALRRSWIAFDAYWAHIPPEEAA